MKRPRVLLADDHRILAEGLRRILEPACEVLETVEDGRALVAAAGKLKPDLIVVDISMPLLNGIEAGRQIKKTNPGAKIIFLTMHTDVNYAIAAFQAGASGYLVKRSAADELMTAIQEVLKGRTYITPLVAKGVLDSLRSDSHKPDTPGRILTPRQREVLQLVAEGRAAKEIADILKVSPKTVEFHKEKIRERLGLHSLAELTQYAIKHGFISA